MNVEFGKCSLQVETRPMKDIAEALFSPEFSPTSTETEESDVQSGHLHFGSDMAEILHLPFVLASPKSPIKTVVSQILCEWKVTLPRMVLYLMTGSSDVAAGKGWELKRLLIRGLIASLNATDMWVCANGLDHGFGRDLGVAYANEHSRRKVLMSSMHKTSTLTFPDSALIGICRQDSVTFSDKLTVSQPSEKEKETAKKDINRNFEYFVFVRDITERSKGIQLFTLDFLCRLSNRSAAVVVLFRGDIAQIDEVLGHLKNELPLVIVDGSGGLADLLAFAYHQDLCRPESASIAEYTETVIKPQISDRISRDYPEFSGVKLSEKVLCQKVFDCIRKSKQGEQDFITLLTLYDLEKETSHLQEHLLRAVFKAKLPETIIEDESMKRDLYLTMDWNCPQVALTQVFAKDRSNKFSVDHDTFYRALIKSQREEFIGVFLDRNFCVHKFLSSSVLLALFQNSLSNEFFRSIVWESLLGYGAVVELDNHFINHSLNFLLKDFTGISGLIETRELKRYSNGIYENFTAEEAERKAIIVLALWGILSYRVNIVKNLWKHCGYPVHLALICSMILLKLRNYASDLGLKKELEKEAKEFNLMGVGLMTKCYDRLPSRAIDLLCEKSPTWSDTPLLEIAAFGKNRKFIAHPCCQKYLDNVFMGRIRVRDLPYGDITIPLWLKITLSTFLIFPMWFWIEFPEGKRAESLANDTSSENQTGFITRNSRSRSVDEEPQARARLPVILRKLYHLYTAPISKFWISRIFYMIYLFIFSLAVIWPSCGSFHLDFIACMWTLFMIIDYFIHIVTMRRTYPSISLKSKYLEVFIMAVFFMVYLFSRVLFHRKFLSPYSAKVILCLALLYFYYREIFIAFPISSELGPMLYRIKRMTLVDFTNFMKVTTLVIISNGIVIHATIYPDYPLGLELIRRAFFDAFISFFLTPADHFGSPDLNCLLLKKRHPNGLSYLGLPEDVCKVGRYYGDDCPNPGVWPYIFGLQYFILLKLILTTLLYALFNNTERILGEEGMNIWRYQRYELVMDFSNRLVFPPPLSPMNYLHLLLRSCYDCIHKKKSEKDDHSKLSEINFSYWKSLASEYFEENRRKKDEGNVEEKDEENNEKWRMEKIHFLMKALNGQGQMMSHLEGYVTDLRIQIENSNTYLEDSFFRVSLMERLYSKHVPQIFSRISPYPYTDISRSPVSDTRVSWKNNWKNYDPIAYNKLKSDFPLEQRSQVDVDIQLLRETHGENFTLPVFQWNSTTLSPGGMYLNRKSWIKGKNGIPYVFELDEEGLPRNPQGRTGLRGRGSLRRWGPNHHVYVIITRWEMLQDYFYHDYLEVVLMIGNHDVSLPGGYVNTENVYLTIWELFSCDTRWWTVADMTAFFKSLAQKPVESSISNRRMSVEQISEYQTSESQVSESLEKKSAMEQTDETASKDETSKDNLMLPFVAERIKKGYFDEATNTDQAWCEAEIWHFHYNVPCNVEEKFKANMLWMQLNENILSKVSEGQASLLHTIAKKMKAVLEIT